MQLPSATLITVAFSQLDGRIRFPVSQLLEMLSEEPSSEKPHSRKGLREYIEILVADDAGQFHHQTQHRGLCWIHEARHYEKRAPSDSDSERNGWISFSKISGFTTIS